MKKSLFILLVLIKMIMPVAAQDMLIKTNGDTIKAKILEVTDDAFRYKKANNPEGPTFVTKKSQIATVIYANGTEEKITGASPAAKPAEEEQKSGEPNIDIRTDPDQIRKKNEVGKLEPIQNGPFGYYYNGLRMSDRRLLFLFQELGDQSIMNEFKHARSNLTASRITGFLGIPCAAAGFAFTMIGSIPEADYNDLSGGSGNKSLLAPGIGLLAGFAALEVASIVLHATYKSKLRQTVNHYNSVIAKHDLN